MFFYLSHKIDLPKVTHQQRCFARQDFSGAWAKQRNNPRTLPQSSLAVAALTTSPNHFRRFHQNVSVPSETLCKVLLRSCESSSVSLPTLSPEKNSPTFCISHYAKKKRNQTKNQPLGASSSTIISVAEIVQVNHTTKPKAIRSNEIPEAKGVLSENLSGQGATIVPWVIIRVISGERHQSKDASYIGHLYKFI